MRGATEKTVLFVTNIPTPYRIPLLNVLRDQLAEMGYGLCVVFCATGYRRRKWTVDLADSRFDYEVLHSEGIAPGGNAERTVFLYGGLLRLFWARRPAVVIVPSFAMATVKAWLLHRARGVPYVIWSGSLRRPGERERAWRRWQRTLLARQAAGGVAYGTRARDYLAGLGLPEGRIEIAINTVDTSFFREETDRLRARRPAPEPGVLLCLGHLTRGKRVDLLLRALPSVVRARPDVRLEIVGEGPDRARLEALAARLGVAPWVRFEGFRQKAALPSYLARAACLLFPSTYDVWGLVLNEAMAAGVPCLASPHAGATRDLIEDGVTGCVVDFSDTARVAERIGWVLDHPAEATAMGRRARCKILRHATLERSAAGFVRAVEKVLAP